MAKTVKDLENAFERVKNIDIIETANIHKPIGLSFICFIFPLNSTISKQLLL